MLLFSVGNGAMNARKIDNCAVNDPRWWQLLDDACTLYRLRDKINAITTRFFFHHGAINFLQYKMSQNL